MQIRYDFTVEVTRNRVVGADLVAQNPLLAGLIIGTAGGISVLACEVEPFAFGEPGYRFWTIDSLALQIGSIELVADQNFYPSQSFQTGLAISNDAFGGGDLFQFQPIFADAPFFDAFFSIQDSGFDVPGQADLVGDSSPITITDYNPAYDTSLGNAFITNGPTASFVGNGNAVFGTPDPSNPLFVLDVVYQDTLEELELSLVGTNSTAFQLSSYR